jgi:hypothetical protein
VAPASPGGGEATEQHARPRFSRGFVGAYPARASHKGGVDAAVADGVHPQAAGCEFHRERAGEGLDRASQPAGLD